MKQEMERLALERKNLVENVKKLDEAMLALRSVAGTSPAVAQRFPHVLQTLAGVRKSVGVDGPQQLLDYTAPPVDLRAMAAAGMGNNAGIVVAPNVTTGPARHTSSLGRYTHDRKWVEPGPRSTIAELTTVPRTPAQQARHDAAAGETCRPSGPWANRVSRHTWNSFNADNLYEKIDGRAESFIQ